ncbi:unnamed protein product [Angiostrongylus costaricensis]|uniref:Transposase n=1 Tax=Angiostrongylus costaricensis TaxID=334426 RepID=A0A0R3PCK0_ANGCS|nr:unnamed protein product [Angiostrongylus costaricensis]
MDESIYRKKKAMMRSRTESRYHLGAEPTHALARPCDGLTNPVILRCGRIVAGFVLDKLTPCNPSRNTVAWLSQNLRKDRIDHHSTTFMKKTKNQHAVAKVVLKKVGRWCMREIESNPKSAGMRTV